MSEPRWITIARKYNGLREVPGVRHNPIILGWLKLINSWDSTDEAPWCGTFIGAMFKHAGVKIPLLAMQAKAWLKWGKSIPVCVGAVGVKSRVGGGHVTFIVGRTKEGRYVGLGGNQGDAVSYALFDPKVFEDFRWPDGEPIPLVVGAGSLPIMRITQTGVVSES
jgi:uncharacterized protein (TIGR02594 family)